MSMDESAEERFLKLTRDQGIVEIFDRTGIPRRYHLRLVPRSKDVSVVRTSSDTSSPPPNRVPNKQFS